MVLAALGWSVAAGVLARALLPSPRPGLAVSLLGGLIGWLVGLGADRVLELHALHPFRPEGLIPATVVTLALLALVRRRTMRRRGRRRTMFFDR